MTSFTEGEPIVNELNDKVFTVITFANGDTVGIPINKIELLGGPFVAITKICLGSGRGGYAADRRAEAGSNSSVWGLKADRVASEVKRILGKKVYGVLIGVGEVIGFDVKKGC